MKRGEAANLKIVDRINPWLLSSSCAELFLSMMSSQSLFSMANKMPAHGLVSRGTASSPIIAQ